MKVPVVHPVTIEYRFGSMPAQTAAWTVRWWRRKSDDADLSLRRPDWSRPSRDFHSQSFIPSLGNDGLGGSGRCTLFVAGIDCGGHVVIRLIAGHGAVGICGRVVQRWIDLGKWAGRSCAA